MPAIESTASVRNQSATGAANEQRSPKGRSVEDAARDFESYIWGTIFSSMYNSIEKSDLFGDGQTENMFQTMLTHEYSRSISSRNGNSSLAAMMIRQMKHEQTSSQPTSDAPIFSRPVHFKSNEIQPLDLKSPSEADAPFDGSIVDLAGVLDDCFGTQRISSGFGWRIDPFNGTRKFHKGIDIPMECGTELRSPVAGRVIFAGPAQGYGNAVVVRTEDGRELCYGHASAVLCKEGTTVKEGDLLCLSGNTGRSTGPHLHFEVRKDGNHLDPLNFFEELKKNSRFANLRP